MKAVVDAPPAPPETSGTAIDFDVGSVTPGGQRAEIDALFGLEDGPMPSLPALDPLRSLARRSASDVLRPSVPEVVPGSSRNGSIACRDPVSARVERAPTPAIDDALSGRVPLQGAASASDAAPGPRRGAEAATDPVLRAFLEGAGVPHLNMGASMTPALAGMVGRLLRESTQGTLDLLVARAIVRRELRTANTLLGARDNNPLKFSPDAEAALEHLLTPHGRGFMSPLRALRDAYQDLRAHQFAIVAGLRDALATVLARFDPERLEQRIAQRRLMDAVLPMNRRARLWDLYAELYVEIAREAEDDFHALFGREFLRSYEAQLARPEVRAAAARSGGRTGEQPTHGPTPMASGEAGSGDRSAS